MSLVLIFFGSLTGLVTALAQVFVLGHSIWLAIATYLALSLLVPLLLGLLAWCFHALRGRDENRGRLGVRKV